MLSNILNLSAFAALATAATITVDVSSSSGALTFSPNSATANVGDEVVFTWQGSSHTVVQGQGVSQACQPVTGGFFSGSQAPPTTFTVNVTNTNPIWFYCSLPGHCQDGMVGVINPPSGTTIEQYAAAASKASSNPAPAGVSAGTGGVLNKGGSSSGSSSSSAASSVASSSAGTSSTAMSSAPATTTSSSSSGNGGYGGGTSTGAGNRFEVPTALALILAGAFAACMW